MIWFFARHGERLQCEIRAASEPGEFELVWAGPDGALHVETSSNPADLSRHRRELEQRLTREGWVRVGRTTPSADEKRFL
jgi:hypothetical protein